MVNKRFFINSLTNFLKQRNPFSKRILILTNLIYPHRLIRRLKHNKSKRFNLKYFINDIPNHKSGVNIEFDRNNPDKSFKFAEQKLREHGAVVIENYFSENLLKSFKQYFLNEINQIKKNESVISRPLKLSYPLLDLWANKELIKFISNYFGENIFFRSYPRLQYVDNNSNVENSSSKKNIAYAWHIDHASVMNQFIYLSEISKNGTLMEIVSGSHLMPLNTSLKFSNSSVIEKNYQTKKLYGPEGSVQLHDPNVLHRALPVKGSDRLSFYSEYSWGENILFDINYVNDMFNKSHIHLEQLEDYQRNLMRGIFPKTPFSGYQIEGQFIKPQVDNSI